MLITKKICITDCSSTSTTQREALAFIALTFIEAHTRYRGDDHDNNDDDGAVTQSQWFISCLTLCDVCLRPLFAILFFC